MRSTQSIFPSRVYEFKTKLILRICFVFLVLINFQAQANFDFNYGASARSYPSLGGDFTLNTGYNIPLWGTPGQGVMYGLVRPSLELSSSVVVYHYDAKVTVYPISFLGLGVGKKELTSKYQEYTYYDCDKTRCEGKLSKEYAFGKLALGYGPFLTTFNYAEFENTYDDENKTNLNVAEYEFILAVNPVEERQIRRNYFAGFKYKGDIIGVVSDQHQFLKSQKDYQLNIAIYQMNFGNIKTVLGMGSLQSTDQKPGAVAVLRFTHVLLPSDALF